MVAEYEASGLGRGEFCRERGLSLSTLLRYRKRPAQTGVAGAGTNGRRIRCKRSCPVIPSDSDENVSKARARRMNRNARIFCFLVLTLAALRSEEHTSELQSLRHL